MDQAQLIERRKALVAEMESIVLPNATEKRKLSDFEDRAFISAKEELTKIDAELANKPGVPPINQRQMKKEESKFSLLKAIRSAVENKPMDEVSAAVIEAGREESRSAGVSTFGNIQIPVEKRATIQATAANAGQEAISEVKLGFIEPLRASLVTVEAGATFLPGLVGDVSIPSYGGTSALWKGESVAAVDGAGATAEVTLSPKRLTTFIKISKQFLAQDSINAEAMLMADIVKSISDKLESTIFGKVAGSATQPAGFFVAAPGVNGVASWANVVALETAVDTANALKTAKYITNAAGRALLKTKVKVANAPAYLMDADGAMNGYPVLVTNHVVGALQVGANEEGIVFGNFADLLIGQWGAIDLTVDPFTAAGTAEIVITVNAYFDAVQRRSVSFKTGSMKA